MGISNTSKPVINAELETVVYLRPMDCKKFPASSGMAIKIPIFKVFLEIFFKRLKNKMLSTTNAMENL